MIGFRPKMSRSEKSPEERVAALLAEPSARAAGLWRVEGDRLVLVAFAPCPELPEEVARGFAEATRSVPLEQGGLGIVAAARGGETAVSRAHEIAGDSGSGRWLRAFGAARSVAVPLCDADGAVTGVLSVALASDSPDDREVAARVGVVGQGWSFPSSE